MGSGRGQKARDRVKKEVRKKKENHQKALKMN